MSALFDVEVRITYMRSYKTNVRLYMSYCQLPTAQRLSGAVNRFLLLLLSIKFAFSVHVHVQCTKAHPVKTSLPSRNQKTYVLFDRVHISNARKCLNRKHNFLSVFLLLFLQGFSGMFGETRKKKLQFQRDKF